MTVSKFVLLLSWSSIFAILWSMIFRVIPRNDLFSWGLELGFLVLALLSAAIQDTKRQ